MPGRKGISGLKYWSFYVNTFDDEKLFELQEQYGPLGEAIHFRLVTMIYEKGYCLSFKSLDSIASIITKSIGTKWVKKKKVLEVIQFLPSCELLDQCSMEQNVLTSNRIQRGWLDVMKAMNRTIPDEKEFWLL